MYNFIKNIKPNNKTNLSKISKKSLNKYCFPNDNQIESKTVSLFSQPFLDSYNQCYKNIVVLNLPPKGPLAKLVRLIKFPPLSEYQQQDNFNQYGYALLSLNGYNENIEYSEFQQNLMIVDEVPDLISFLLKNGYIIDTNITKMFHDSEISFKTNFNNKLICFITYNI